MFRGADCHSLAVTVGAAMDLRPILPSVKRYDEKKSYKTGLLSLTKHDLILVMSFLERVKLLHPPLLPLPPASLPRDA